MKIFACVKAQMGFLGLVQFEEPHKKIIIMILRIICITTMVTEILTHFVFVFFEAKTFEQQTDSFYALMTSLFLFITYCLMIHQRIEIFDLISQMESKIRERMTVSGHHSSVLIKLEYIYIAMGLYDAANEKIEKRSKLMQNILLKVLITFYGLSNIIVSYFNFYVRNLSEGSFRLIFYAS